MNLRNELKTLISNNPALNRSNTPDHVLAEYLFNALESFHNAALERDKYTKNPSEVSLEENLYGVQLKPVTQPTEGLKAEPNMPIPAKVGNTTTSTGWSNPFAGTSWGV
jgi:hypothetical protein